MIVTKKEEEGEKPSVVPEINLISAQGLKLPSSVTGRRVRTYALAWVDPAAKLQAGIDCDGGENPTWNDRFLFRVTPEFLSGETSDVYVEIYAVGRLRDSLVGTVRFLIGNFLDVRSKTPSFTALQIRRPSGNTNQSQAKWRTTKKTRKRKRKNLASRERLGGLASVGAKKARRPWLRC